MENRLCLNKRPTYKLPDNVMVGNYDWRRNKPTIPNFEPDICINIFGCLGVKEPRATAGQYWIKSNNKELLRFIENYDFEKLVKNKITNAYTLPLWQLKKILLEEFYGVKKWRIDYV